MIGLYGKLATNDKDELCIDGIPVALALLYYVGQEVSLSISSQEETEESEE